MEGARIKAFTAVNHQGEIKMFSLHSWGALQGSYNGNVDRATEAGPLSFLTKLLSGA